MVDRMRWLTIMTGALLLGLVAAGPAQATQPTAGARTLGDPLLPQLGNGGYDVDHYRVALDYDPAANVFNSATTTIRATADAKLKEFSLDFQEMDISSVRVDGREADFSQVEATPDLSSDPDVTQPMKLVVEPQPSTWPKPGRDFTVQVRYSGEPHVITDPDTSIEGLDPGVLPAEPPADLRRRVRGRRADGVAGLVPVEQLPDRQGHLRHPDQGAAGEDGAWRR